MLSGVQRAGARRSPRWELTLQSALYDPEPDGRSTSPQQGKTAAKLDNWRFFIGIIDLPVGAAGASTGRKSLNELNTTLTIHFLPGL